jgi:pimeloyl-ACP methyl ester carboxylesterase
MELIQLVKGLKINYKETGKGTQIVLLHGWGSNLQIFEKVQQYFQNDFNVIAIDLPGFGKSEQPTEVWGVEEYTSFIEDFFEFKNIINPILVAHSFGGRISILFSSRNPVLKLVLLDSAGIRPTRSFDYYLKVYSYKLIRKALPVFAGKNQAEIILEKYRKKAGSSDYKNASGIMRQILVKAVNEDLKIVMSLIKAPTLLIWGENDTATPVSDARIMEKLIPNAGLVVLKNVGHFSFIEKLNEFLIILNNFLQVDKKNS